MIKTKSTEDPISSRDGLRLFVTRYWPRGHRREECDEWVPSLAPSETLLHQFQSSEITWKQFERDYKNEMLRGLCDESSRNPRIKNSGQKYWIRLLKNVAQQRTITLICSCPLEAANCHRHLLQALLDG